MEFIKTVSELTSEIKEILETEFEEIKVVGELSNFKAHYSGHWYFTLKDSNAQISCTMWKGINNYVFFTPQDGMKVIITGRITVYPPRGNYQIDVRSMKAAGEGELQQAFEKLKRKLSDEGLFDEQYKVPIPAFPKKIGIVTAIDGAALRDMISVADRRFPLVELIVAGAKVQGQGSAEDIANKIGLLNKQKDIDLIIIGRGGGSLEDLWAFNEEITARSIFASKIPIISGVGHEVDFTIADFVADLRAPTPTAAMELATPDQLEIFDFLKEFSYSHSKRMKEIIVDKKLEIDNLINTYGFRIVKDNIKNKYQFLDSTTYKLQNNIKRIFSDNKNKLELFEKILDANNFTKILKKGYTVVSQENHYIDRASKIDSNKKIKIKFFDNEIELN